MLKWLKQKPSSGGHGDVTSEKMTTDDPLATIQVHPINTKKLLKNSVSNNSNTNEIYAVSRFVFFVQIIIFAYSTSCIYVVFHMIGTITGNKIEDRIRVGVLLDLMNCD